MGELYLDLRKGEVTGNFPSGLNLPDALNLLRMAVERLQWEFANCNDYTEYADYDEGKVFAA